MTIQANDTPAVAAPLTFDKASTLEPPAGADILKQITATEQFTLDVAAETTLQTVGANQSYWAEASQTWRFYGNGTVAGVPAPFGAFTQYVWRALPGSGTFVVVNATVPVLWPQLASPRVENISGPSANSVVNSVLYTTAGWK